MAMVNARSPQLYRFEDDGETPNNPRLPLVHYCDVLRFPSDLDPAAVCEELFAQHGWSRSWRNGIYGFVHFHLRTHEVLGIARGAASVQFGGDKGRTLTVEAGDVVALPAGTGHRRMTASADLLVVDAYPTSGIIDQARPNEVDLAKAHALIVDVPPALDPVYGHNGPLTELWARR